MTRITITSPTSLLTLVFFPPLMPLLKQKLVRDVVCTIPLINRLNNPNFVVVSFAKVLSFFGKANERVSLNIFDK